MDNNFDFIAIGDTVTDAFIHLEDSSAHLAVRHGTREICLRFGDKIPYDAVYVVPGVGNSANAAVSAGRLGLKTALVSDIGDDDNGKEILDVMKTEGVAGDYILAHAGRKTNYHYVLWFQSDRTILIKHEKYEYHLPDIGVPRWIYLSSAGENSLPYHGEIEAYLKVHPEVKLAFQPGTYQMKFGAEALKGIYQRAEIFFCNKEESRRILKTEEKDIKKLLSMMNNLGPKIVCITDGPDGAYAYDGKEYLSMPIYPDPKPPLQRTGAGDAFSSTITVALALGMSLRDALRWGPVNSMSVVQQIGARAGLLTREQLEKYLHEAPKGYEPRPF